MERARQAAAAAAQAAADAEAAAQANIFNDVSEDSEDRAPWLQQALGQEPEQPYPAPQGMHGVPALMAALVIASHEAGLAAVRRREHFRWFGAQG